VWAPSLEIPSLKSDAKLAYILDALSQLADPRLQVPDLHCSEHVPGRLSRELESFKTNVDSMCAIYGVDPQFFLDDDGGGDGVHSRVPNFLLGEDVRERIRRD
jgi:hypothetical protein